MIGFNEKEEYVIACMQLNTILNMLPDKEKDKIPSNFLKEIKRYKLKNYIYIYDYSKDLKDQEMSDLTREVLYSIYLNYLCDDEKRKRCNDQIQLLMKNISISEFEKDKKYEGVFNKSKEKSEKYKNNKDNNRITEYKKNYFRKLISKLKNILKDIYLHIDRRNGNGK